MSLDGVSTVVRSTSGLKPRWFRTSSAPILPSPAANADPFHERFRGAGGVSLGLYMSTQDCVGPGSYIRPKRWYPAPGDTPARSCPTTPHLTPPTSPLHDASFRSGQLRVPEVRRETRAELLDLSWHGRKEPKSLYSLMRKSSAPRFPTDSPSHVPVSYLPLDDPRQMWAQTSADNGRPELTGAIASDATADRKRHSPPLSPSRGVPARGHSVFRSSCLRVPEAGPESWVLLQSHGSEPGGAQPDLEAMPWHSFSGRSKARSNGQRPICFGRG